jgi:hypothetical protein
MEICPLQLFFTTRRGVSRITVPVQLHILHKAHRFQSIIPSFGWYMYIQKEKKFKKFPRALSHPHEYRSKWGFTGANMKELRAIHRLELRQLFWLIR